MIESDSASHPQAASPPGFTLELDAWGYLSLLTADGARHEKVIPVHAFPMTAPDRWISIRASSGEELALVKDPAMLPTAVRTLLEQELSHREFSPRITQIHSIKRAEYGVLWDVETDRGPVKFKLESEESIRNVGDRGAVIIDSHGIRYRILDVLDLDRASRRRLERYF